MSKQARWLAIHSNEHGTDVRVFTAPWNLFQLVDLGDEDVLEGLADDFLQINYEPEKGETLQIASADEEAFTANLTAADIAGLVERLKAK